MTEQTSALVPAEDSRMSLGQTALRPQDLVIPRVKVVQQMSKEAADKDAESGDFYNTLTGESYGNAIRIQPIQTFMQRVFLVRADRREKIEEALGYELSEGDGLKCRSYDMLVGTGEPGGECDACPLSQWNGHTPPLCTETYNVAAATELGDLVVLSFAKSSAKVGKRFFSAMRFGMAGAAPWTRFFDLHTKQDRNDKGTFYVPEFKIASDRPDTGQIAQALHWAQQLRGVQIDVTPDDAAPEDVDGGGSDVSDEGNPF